MDNVYVRSGIVVGSVVLGTVVWLLLTAVSDGWVVPGPALLGVLVAVVAGARRPFLGVAVATFVAVGAVGAFLMGPDARNEGGFFLVIVVVLAEILFLYVTAGIWLWIARSGRTSEE